MQPFACFNIEYTCEARSCWILWGTTERYCISSLFKDIPVTTSPICTLPVLSIPPECPTFLESLATTNSATTQLVSMVCSNECQIGLHRAYTNSFLIRCQLACLPVSRLDWA